MDLIRNRRALQKACRNRIGIEIFQTGKKSGCRSPGFSLGLQKGKIFFDIRLRGIENIHSSLLIRPFHELANVTHVRRNGIARCLLYLSKIILISMNQI